MVKILDIEGLKVLWSKISSVFAKKADLDNYLPVSNNMVRVQEIKPMSDEWDTNNSHNNHIYVGNIYNIDYNDFSMLRNYSGINVNTFDGNISICGHHVGILAFNSKLSSHENTIVNGGDVWITNIQGAFDGITNNITSGIHIDDSDISIATKHTKLLFKQNDGDTIPYIVSDKGFAIANGVGDFKVRGSVESPGQDSATCSFYTSNSRTIVGWWNSKERTRNNAEFKEGTIRFRINDDSILKLSDDAKYKTPSLLGGIDNNVVAFNNFYVVNSINDVAGLSVEYDPSNRVVVTFGDSSTRAIDYPIRFRIDSATYALDLNALMANKLAVKL